MSFLRDTISSAGAGLAMSVSRFLAMAIIARELGVGNFGILGFSMFCLDLIVLFALAGLPGLTSRFMPLASLRRAARTCEDGSNVVDCLGRDRPPGVAGCPQFR